VTIHFVSLIYIFGILGWINEFLSWRIFVPLGKLSYCVYLIHLPVIYILALGARTGTYYSTLMFVSACPPPCYIVIITMSYFIF